MIRLGVWVAVLVAGTAALLHLGGGLAAPPLAGGWHGLVRWADGRDAAVIVMAMLRIVAIGAGAYLALITVAGAVVRCAGNRRALRVVDRVTVPMVRRLLGGITALTLLTATAASASPRVDAPSIVPLDPARPTAPSAPPSPRPVTPPAPREWSVAPGDNFWAIAVSVLQHAWHRPPTDAEVVPYWHALIDRNRSRLRDPGNPDLIYPGQVLTIPDVGGLPPRSP